jgi:peptidoglycan/xylan/chitin deacetylase (PgdA/CDA1 family)
MSSNETTNSIPVQNRQRGLFVISLDFELYWGVRHLPSLRRYLPNLIGARSAIPALLDLFSEYEIHATWATVGFLFCDQTRTLLKFAPSLHRPEYKNRILKPYYDLPPEGATDTPDSIFFAPSLIRLIANTAHQEVATHSFSHFYCLEKGQDIEAFRQDLLAARAASYALGLELRSMVFPKNQCNDDYLIVCAEAGILAYRGTPPGWLYRAAADDEQRYVKRLGRLLDTYLPLGSRNCYPAPVQSANLPINLRGSRFLRPYSPLFRMFEPLRLHRIKRDLTEAARKGLFYHLWWHPHNFGVNTEANLAFLRKILEHYRFLQEAYGMESANMGEMAACCLRERLNGQSTKSGSEQQAAGEIVRSSSAVSR